MAPLLAWLRPIIILLVVVGLVEMLIPQGALGRYVDLFLGVLLLGALLQPMVSLLGGTLVWDPGGLVDQALQEEAGPPAQPGAVGAPELAREVFAQRLEREVVRLARTVDGVAAAAARITLAPAPPGQVPPVAAVHLGLVLGDAPDRQGAGPLDPSGSPEPAGPPAPVVPPAQEGFPGRPGGAGMLPVQPVQPVEPIAPIGAAGLGDGLGAPGPGEVPAPPSPAGQGAAGPWRPGAPEPQATAVLALLRHHFDFPPELVTLYWRPAAGEGRESLDDYTPGEQSPGTAAP